jgi:very-short-patch-repair endonuclease
VQVVIRGVGRVDLLVEGRLIVELDGRETHHDDEAFERDRLRDVATAIDGYRSLRLSYRQVMYGWPRAQEAVFAALAS